MPRGPPRSQSVPVLQISPSPAGEFFLLRWAAPPPRPARPRGTLSHRGGPSPQGRQATRAWGASRPRRGVRARGWGPRGTSPSHTGRSSGRRAAGEGKRKGCWEKFLLTYLHTYLLQGLRPQWVLRKELERFQTKQNKLEKSFERTAKAVSGREDNGSPKQSFADVTPGTR